MDFAYEEAGAIVRKLYIDNGAELFLEKGRLKATLADYLPRHQKENKILALAVDEGIPYKIVKKGKELSSEEISTLSRDFSDAYAMELDISECVIRIFDSAVYGTPLLRPTISSYVSPPSEAKSLDYQQRKTTEDVYAPKISSAKTIQFGAKTTGSGVHKSPRTEIIGLVVVVLIITIAVALRACSSNRKNEYFTSSKTQTNTMKGSNTAPSTSENSQTTIPLHDLETLSTEWGNGSGNYHDEAVTDYYGNKYYGYYDFAAIDSPYPSFKESYVRIPTKGEWQYLSGTYFPRAWEHGDYYVRLSVYADDMLVYQGDWMSLASRAVPINVDIKNVMFLK